MYYNIIINSIFIEKYRNLISFFENTNNTNNVTSEINNNVSNVNPEDKSKWQKFKDWVKQHKTEILIGVGVLTAAAIAYYIYKNGILTFFQKEKSYPTIDCLQKNKKMYNKYITIDLETRQLDNNITPYCISLYDGKSA